jgi:hypothetical protein
MSKCTSPQAKKMKKCAKKSSASCRANVNKGSFRGYLWSRFSSQLLMGVCSPGCYFPHRIHTVDSGTLRAQGQHPFPFKRGEKNHEGKGTPGIVPCNFSTKKGRENKTCGKRYLKMVQSNCTSSRTCWKPKFIKHELRQLPRLSRLTIFLPTFEATGRRVHLAA